MCLVIESCHKRVCTKLNGDSFSFFCKFGVRSLDWLSDARSADESDNV